MSCLYAIYMTLVEEEERKYDKIRVAVIKSLYLDEVAFQMG